MRYLRSVIGRTAVTAIVPTFSVLFTALFVLSGCSSESTVGEGRAFSPSDTLCARFGCVGEFVEGLQWSDSRGENLFFLTSKEIETEQGITQGLYAWRFVLLDGGAMRQTWTWSTEAENWCDAGEGLIGDIELTDINGDGVGEVSWVYNVAGNCDVSPRSFGLVMHTGVGSGAYEINGTDRREIYGDIAEAGRMELSTSLASAPDTFQVWTQNLWTRHVPQE